jgi:hypothetical protein
VLLTTGYKNGVRFFAIIFATLPYQKNYDEKDILVT